MVSPRSSAAAVDKITKSPKCNILASMVIDGALDMKTIQSKLEDLILQNPLKDRYKQLFQVIVNWCGY